MSNRASKKLRKLLEECNLNYLMHYFNMSWCVGPKLYNAVDNLNGTLTVDNLTPEQAIAATLRSEECKLEKVKNYERGCITTAWGTLCSACGAFFEFIDGTEWKCCPKCERKAVKQAMDKPIEYPFCGGEAEPPMTKKWTNCLGDESFSDTTREVDGLMHLCEGCEHFRLVPEMGAHLPWCKLYMRYYPERCDRFEHVTPNKGHEGGEVMSMFSLQANELRGYARSVQNIAINATNLDNGARRDLLDGALCMNQAADEIENLRNRLQDLQGVGGGECKLVEVDSYINDREETIYVFECSVCGETCEHVNGIYPKCPHCGAKAVIR